MAKKYYRPRSYTPDFSYKYIEYDTETGLSIVHYKNGTKARAIAWSREFIKETNPVEIKRVDNSFLYGNEDLYE